MGRPLNSKYFGDPDLSAQPKLCISEAWIPNTDYPTALSYVVEQTATREYVVSDGVNTGPVSLTDSITREGEAIINVYPYGIDTVEHAYLITSHRVKTWEGGDYSWSTLPATKPGEADLLCIPEGISWNSLSDVWNDINEIWSEM